MSELGSDNVDGLFGPRFLVDKRFTLDYRNRILAVSSSPMPADIRDGGALPLFWQDRYTGMIVVSGAVNGREVSDPGGHGKEPHVCSPRAGPSFAPAKDQ